MVVVLSIDPRSPSLFVVTGGPGVALVLLFAAALGLGRPGWIGTVLGFLALLFFAHLLLADAFSPEGAAIVGVALLVAGELGQWSLDGRLARRYEVRLQVSRAVGIAWLGLLGVGVEVLCLVAVGLPIATGIGTVAIAMAAAVALLGLFSSVAARAPIGSGRHDTARPPTMRG